MLLRYFFDENLAHASYMVGCQATGEAIIIDPSRDITPYLKAAKAEGLNIIAGAETHIHADFVSGSRELANDCQAELFLSDEGGDGWSYKNQNNKTRYLKDGDEFNIGNIFFEVMHSPGHTPESLSFILTDKGDGATQPMGIFTGDFVFVGDVGRPDLLEKAADEVGAADEGARTMYHSLKKFKELPDHLQVWPAHGAGSACGKALGSVPSSTVGYEKLFNKALSYNNEEDFVQALLKGQPEPPKYFGIMKKINKEGPILLDDLGFPKEIPTEQLQELLNEEAQILDTSSYKKFADKHIQGTINIPYAYKQFLTWAGWLIDYDKPLYLLADPNHIENIVHSLRSIGIDQLEGYVDIKSALNGDFLFESYKNEEPSKINQEVKENKVHLIDVRNQSEWEEGSIPGARHIMLGTIPYRLKEIPIDKPIVLHCRTGIRSAIGASVLQAKGIKNVINLSGGYHQWRNDVGVIV
ncbi:rhodanese-like domain-containing protein [Alteribacillus sp. YIM 98480]|uniref:MBL fold metallo-hydrolase n=1 Tax=Alteribacillus sp. YIM 98480 TaxID=2606599 RepID=UPI00131B7C6A|nr:MBL fold metallo-hydrolase [Alteribacillus sp. YIM 98480]